MTDELERLRDQAAIVDLVHEYARNMDLARPSELVELFVEDCLVDYGEGLGGRIEGRSALRSFFEAGLQNVLATSHHISNVQVKLESSSVATAISYVYAWHRFPDEHPDAELWGQYHDRLGRTSERWRIAERTLRVAGQNQMPMEGWHPLGRRHLGEPRGAK